MTSSISRPYFVDSHPFSLHSTLTALSLRPGHKVLLIGHATRPLANEIARCLGSTLKVVATEVSEQQLAIAQENLSAASITNLTFQQVVPLNIDAVQGTFNSIYCRLAPSPLDSGSACALVSEMLSKLEPMGRLVLEAAHPLCKEAEVACNTAPAIRDYLESKGYKITYTTPRLHFPLKEPGLYQTIAQISLTKYY